MRLPGAKEVRQRERGEELAGGDVTTSSRQAETSCQFTPLICTGRAVQRGQEPCPVPRLQKHEGEELQLLKKQVPCGLRPSRPAVRARPSPILTACSEGAPPGLGALCTDHAKPRPLCEHSDRWRGPGRSLHSPVWRWPSRELHKLLQTDLILLRGPDAVPSLVQALR
ncbi:hypothetical protein Anapl_10229 [Anas platyrhynchos]|uniref:Uncharacterized protein n=1 Tax=Anas platyrhynchos TaxID=8839 RepID=R0LHF0_ANAPL|nr:hypothetical protein Anapl_10229 [Anas platyrhynchos]